ncbi:Mce family protein [Mycobacteroides abscessus subsp. abscessus]|uniref:MlaD family protein n=1 Tax=Mycobacteroides abscessus TaxID=36809 RepID=UPI0009290C8B|nr:MlaD family protein [Mycobacteroides abscessus]SHU87343.1 Mce family protein [Mycobacteroides abscessus subsp. abscessus]SHW47404.1 Mce family protein [Mycobacteroides abscessus subsp. abscessus]SIH61982.1 Mce family protein [Mycobacteroides abscessus subsp. abscessus]SKD15696.1 Mce family protein [Mycobacteroides abscessus subsp. abscessus]SKN01704.1 Mce family protein [Mycobacteroides abscessus subsp. abscessus]
MKPSPKHGLSVGIVWILAVAIVTAGCGLNPVKMRPPTLSESQMIPVVIEFSNALNLPLGAKVSYGGNAVGSVRSVRLDNGVVAVAADVDASAGVPSDATAAIVQDTVLGDSYVSLNKPTGAAEGAPALAAGARIPVSRTRPPNSIEDMMVTLSSFIGSGSFQRLQGMLRQVNASMPQDIEDLRRVSSTIARDIRSLAGNTSGLDRSIDNLSRLASTLKNNAAYVEDFTSAASVDFWSKFWGVVGSVVGLLGSLGDLLFKGVWIVPLLDSVSTALEQTGPPGGGSSIDTFTNQTLLPFLLDPQVQITQSVTPDGTDRTADTRRVLAQLGALR